MARHMDAQDVLDFWFPGDIEVSDAAAQWRRLEWWMRGGATPELARFAPLLGAARAGTLDHWAATPRGRLALVVVLDQFPRGLHEGTPEAYASDKHALALAEEGFANGHYGALQNLYQRFFFFLPLAHAEGPGHLERLRRIVAVSEQILSEAPPASKPIWRFSLSQAEANRDVIARFGRFPHRNAILGRVSTAEEAAYIAQGDFVHRRALPADAIVREGA